MKKEFKPVVFEAKGLIKLPGRKLMTFAEYRKEFGRSPITGEKMMLPKKMLQNRGRPAKIPYPLMSLPVMEKLSRDYLIPGLIEKKK